MGRLVRSDASVDLDKRQPIDMLPDREGKTLEAWFQDHPGVELVTRDRSSVYASAITTACPDAVQVADRCNGSPVTI